MENTRIAHWKKNKHVWREGKQVKENKTLKQRFKQAMARVKENLSFNYEEEDLEGVD